MNDRDLVRVLALGLSQVGRYLRDRRVGKDVPKAGATYILEERQVAFMAIQVKETPFYYRPSRNAR
jgi:hypothetical protein